MKKIRIENLQPDFSGAQVGNVVLNQTTESIFIKEWANSQKNGYSPQEIPVGEEVTLTEDNIPLELHIGMGQ